MTYKLVPLSSETGTQLVDGKANALEIANEIAQRERTYVHVLKPGGELVTEAQPYPALYDRDHPAERLPDWRRLTWWCGRHAARGRTAALPLFWTLFAEGRRA
jgi:hypothetical protein